MSLFTVTSIPLAPIPGLHSGTGTHQNSNWLVVPASVPGSGALQFTGAWVEVTTMLFQLNANVVPNWFGVAVPHGVTDFTKANIFFHPMPAQAGYKDSDYPTKAGKWPQLFYYMERLGYKLDGAARNQIIVMPFLTNAATDTGIFPANWIDLVPDILVAVRAIMGADDGSPLALSQVIVSSFSVGIVYSANFRAKAASINSYLAEVWDFDGLFSTSSQLSKDLNSTARYTAIKYDQGGGSGSYHVPLPRWSACATPPKSAIEVHGLIRDYMFLHAASVSSVGLAIAGGGDSTASTGNATITGSTGISTSTTTGSTGGMPTSATTGNVSSSGESGVTPTPGIFETTGMSSSQSGSGASTGVTGPTVPAAPRYPVAPPMPVTVWPPTPQITLPVPLQAPPMRAGQRPQDGPEHHCCCSEAVAIVAETGIVATTALTAVTGLIASRNN